MTEMNMMTYQQYLNYFQMNQGAQPNPTSNVFPTDFNCDVNDSTVNPYYWTGMKYEVPVDMTGMGVGMGMGYCEVNELPLGTHLSEIVEYDKNGSNPPVRKKRKYSELESSKDVSAVKLTRDQILKISSQEFDDYLARLNLGRNLTKHEEKEIKRQKRLIKNREYAYEARKKKKEYVTNMETEVKILKKEKDELLERISGLEDEVQYLRSELEKVSESSMMTSSDDDFNRPDTPPTHLFEDTPVPNYESEWSFSGFQQGFFLMAILFSFGLFFNIGFTSKMEPPQQSPFLDNIPENTLPSSGPWTGPRKLSGVGDAILETRLTPLSSDQSLKTVDDIISDEHQELLQFEYLETHCPSELFYMDYFQMVCAN